MINKLNFQLVFIVIKSLLVFWMIRNELTQMLIAVGRFNVLLDLVVAVAKERKTGSSASDFFNVVQCI